MSYRICMHQPLYREALAHSWQFAVRNKMLWLSGLFAGALGQVGLWDFFLSLNRASRDAVLSSGWWKLPSILAASVRESGLTLPAEGWIWLVWLGVIALGFFVFFVLTVLVSQGALIHASAQSVLHGRVHFDTAWKAGVTHMGRLFGLNLVRKLAIFMLSLMLGWASFNALVAGTPLDRLLFIALFFLAIMVGAVISFLTVYAASYVVVENYSLGQGIASAWHLFTGHWVVSFEVAGLLILAQLLTTLLVVLGTVFFFFFPSIFVWGAAFALESQGLLIAGYVLGLSLVLIWILLIAGLFSMFATATWTYLFMKMHREGIKSRVAHFFEHKL